jgi:hypothetical protein
MRRIVHLKRLEQQHRSVFKKPELKKITLLVKFASRGVAGCQKYSCIIRLSWSRIICEVVRS